MFFARTFFSSVSARAVSFFSRSKFLKLLFCWTSCIALTNLPYNSSRSLCVYIIEKTKNRSCLSTANILITLTKRQKKHSKLFHILNAQKCTWTGSSLFHKLIIFVGGLVLLIGAPVNYFEYHIFEKNFWTSQALGVLNVEYFYFVKPTLIHQRE